MHSSFNPNIKIKNFGLMPSFSISRDHVCSLKNVTLESADFPRMGFYDLETTKNPNLFPNFLIFQFEKDEYGTFSEVVFNDSSINIPFEFRIRENFESFDYIPLPENDINRPRFSKSQKQTPIDYSAVFDDEQYPDVIDRFLAFINQKYFRNFVIMAHNGSRQIVARVMQI